MVASSVPLSCQACPHVQHSLLGTCQHAELSLVASGKQHQFYHKGQVIFQQGSRAAGLYCIFQGKVKVSKLSADGKEQIVRLAREGDVLCYRSLMMGQVCTTAATALTDCIVCLIPRPDFFSLLGQNSQFTLSLLQLMARNLGEAEERLLHAAYKPVRQRLADALLLLHRAFQPSEEGQFSMPVSREDLAALTGTTKETASRLLSELRDTGIILTRGSRITILQKEELTQLASMYS